VELGGPRGRRLSARVSAIENNFTDYFSWFASRSYDVLDPEDKAFVVDLETFRNAVDDLDRRLAAILCQAFDDCHTLESVFKVCVFRSPRYCLGFRIQIFCVLFQLLNVVGSLLERPLVKKEFSGKYDILLDMIAREFAASEVTKSSFSFCFFVSGL